MKVGIFFGGQSREREVSFAGGRTVYDNLDKNLFEAVPIFVDSWGNFILLDWQYIYKGSIRDFYPPMQSSSFQERAGIYADSKFQIYLESLGELSPREQDELISHVGKPVEPKDFAQYIDFAFLALHGAQGEDGSLQGLLEWYGIPYSGSGILPSAIGIDKAIQSQIMRQTGFSRPKQKLISRDFWQEADKSLLFEELKKTLGLPLVIKAPHQGSSIGVSVLKSDRVEDFIKAVQRSLFIEEIDLAQWQKLSPEAQEAYMLRFTDIREGLGFPVQGTFGNTQHMFYHPEELLDFLREVNYSPKVTTLRLEAQDSEELLLFESFIEGKEFSCIVLQKPNGEPIALPPTEIQKYENMFNYRAKYLPGMSRKITPIQVDSAQIEAIREACCALYKALNCNVYARIDGFISPKGEVLLNDPNTTSGMLPSSFFFHQAAEIHLDPTHFITYIIRVSLNERLKSGKKTLQLRALQQKLAESIARAKSQQTQKVKVAVIMGGFSSERHISMESGRNIYEKLASSVKYEPIPIFLTGNEQDYQLYRMPIHTMLKDNADDIRDKILNFSSYKNAEQGRVLEKIRQEAESITKQYVAEVQDEPQRIELQELPRLVEAVFIALHGRPGEDGNLQKHLEAMGLPYNGSGIESSSLTINKYETNAKLREAGVLVAKHRLVEEEEWQKDPEALFAEISENFKFPIIAKPADEGCSSAVKKLRSRAEFEAFAQMMFRKQPEFLSEPAEILKLKAKEEFPQKNYFLIEELIEPQGAQYFLEITGGMLTKYQDDGSLVYEVFEPSETLATGEVLSLEEKFLAGEGQNITPARYAKNPQENQQIAAQVKAELERVAKLLNIEGYARIDAFVRVKQNLQTEVIIIEINSLPGMTPATCIFHQSAINRYKPYDFIEAILEFGKKREQKGKNRPQTI